MGSVIENEKTKEKCQIFTPDDIVKSMLDHLGYSDHLYGKTILETKEKRPKRKRPTLQRLC